MKINIAVWWVLDYDTGCRETLGGLERWTRDIVLELVSRGYDVSVFQKSAVPYEKIYHGARIIGVKSSRNFSGNLVFYREFKKRCSFDDLAIFISQDLLWGSEFKRSVAVNHGVWWSSRQSKIKRWALEFFNELYLKRASQTICVDTNYINWAIESVSGAHSMLSKLVYIPNYFDPRLFKARRGGQHEGELKILFPRRIMGDSIESEPRGGEDAIRALQLIRQSGVNATLTMLGEGNLSTDLKRLVVELGLDEFVSFRTASFDDMPSFYETHEIVFVPSRFSEGTSLSAIEGLAAGCYVVGSCVGGLQNLPLFPPFGNMVVPNPGELANAVLSFADNNLAVADLERSQLRNRVIDRFSIDRWKDSVLTVIENVANGRN